VASLSVVCLNWNNYLRRGAEYVGKLQRAVARNLTVPHEFVVVTEKDLPEGRKGWFNKLYLLEMFDGPALFLDLDVVVTANIDHLVEIARSDTSRIWARDDWSYPVTNPRNGREATINSSVMLWHGRKDMTGAERLIPETHGDQGIITQLFWPHEIGLLPNDSVGSYKYEVLRGKKPAPITVFHGVPKVHEVNEPWVRQHWS
jgi:hypothetical protein